MNAGLTQALLGVPGPAAAAALRVRWQQMPLLSRWGWGALALFFLLLAAGIAWLTRWRFTAPLLAAGVGAVAMLVWAGLMAGLLEQNQPQLARLVPGHLRVLRRLAVALWALLAFALGALAWWVFDGRVAFGAWVMAIGLFAAALAWCERWPALWFVLGFAPALWPLLPNRPGLQAAGLGVMAWWQAHAMGATAVVLGLLALSVAAVFGRGDARHARAFERRNAWSPAARRPWGDAQAPGAAAREHPLAWVVRPLAAGGDAWLAHLLRHAAPTRRSVMARVELVLHGCQHWLWHLMGVGVVLLAIVLVVALLLTLSTGPVPMEQVWKNGHFGIAVGIASMGLNLLFLLRRALWTSRREQALLMLLPGMPRGRALNGAVARLQLRHAGVAWAVTTAVLLAVYLVAGTALGVCVVVVALPLGVFWLLRAPATLPQGSGLRDALPIAACLVGGALLLLAVFGWREAAAPAPLAAVAAAGVALAGIIGAWRWRQVMAAPQALPAGRLG